MTTPTQPSATHHSPRITPFSQPRGIGRNTRGLFIAVAVLGLGGAAAGWLLTHKSETPAAGTTPTEGTIVDPLAQHGGDGSVITVDTPAPANAMGASVPTTTGVSTGTGAGAGAGTGAAVADMGAVPSTVAVAGTGAPMALRVQQATAMIGTDPIRARVELTRLLDSNQLSAAERVAAYQGINSLAEQLFLSPRIVPGDTLSQSYIVKRGDNLTKIAKGQKLGVECSFIQRINGMANDRALRPDMRLKLVAGPFDAEVVKADFRVNIYAGGATAERVMVASFPCGLGANDSTPTGAFKVKSGSKLRNPEWRNPHTGEYFGANDPKNPIGERWIGLQGATAETSKFTSYGIHGTVEPQSIGRQASMGCVRLGDAEVQVVYELLGEASTVTIR